MLSKEIFGYSLLFSPEHGMHVSACIVCAYLQEHFLLPFEMLHMSHFHGLNMFEFKSVQRVFGWDQNVVSIYAAMLFRVGTCAWERFQKKTGNQA